MGVAVLSPENYLRDGFPYQHRHLISPPRSKPRRSSATYVPSPPQSRSGRRKQQRSPASSSPPPLSSSSSQAKPNNDGKACRAKSPAITGQLRILKRGEEFTPTKQSIAKAAPVKDRKTKREGSVDRVNSDSVVCSTDQMTPEPVPAPNPNPLSGFYAGSAFFTSPPPSSVPLPAFFTKKIGAGAGAGGLTKSSAEDAAVDLRRILRLEL